MSTPRILVAGIGNIFLGDDAFGVEVVNRLSRRALPDSVRVVDYGIRGLDLAYALLDDYDLVILVDAARQGEDPGTLYVLEPELTAADGDVPASLPDGRAWHEPHARAGHGAGHGRTASSGCWWSGASRPPWATNWRAPWGSAIR